MQSVQSIQYSYTVDLTAKLSIGQFYPILCNTIATLASRQYHPQLSCVLFKLWDVLLILSRRFEQPVLLFFVFLTSESADGFKLQILQTWSQMVSIRVGLPSFEIYWIQTHSCNFFFVSRIPLVLVPQRSWAISPVISASSSDHMSREARLQIF